MKILAVSRSLRFSPNSVARDEAIFRAVGERLEDKGHDVCYLSEDNPATIADRLKSARLIYTMARNCAALHLLSGAEKEGLRIVNSPKALLTYTRGALFSLFAKNGIRVPRTWPIRSETDLQGIKAIVFPLWIKRSDECAQVKDDVRLVGNAENLRQDCADAFSRGARELLLCEHIRGRLFKFYGVEGTDFFHVFPVDGSHSFSKFGLEHTCNVPSVRYTLDKNLLKHIADRAARLWGISVYGGDAVVGKDGLFIIDFNDWPSFSPCREAAAESIAECLLKEYEQ